MSDLQRVVANKIYDEISSQSFAEWYGLKISSFEDFDTNENDIGGTGATGGDFDNHIRHRSPSKEEILEQIVQRFRL